MRVLYVCQGNVSRSPAAAIITRAKCNGRIEVDSAAAGRPPLMGMVIEMGAALERCGYKRCPHEPKMAGRDILELQDVVLCMEKQHADELRKFNERTFTLPEYAGFPGEEVYDADVRIWNIPRLRSLPDVIRKYAFKCFGKVDFRDREGVIQAHVLVVNQLEKYISRALERMEKEFSV